MKQAQGRPFRSRLRAEIDAWVRDGIIDGNTRETLALRYDFDHLSEPGLDLLARVLIAIGALFVGGAIISFVAAHWNGIAPWWRFALVGGVTLAAYACAAYAALRLRGAPLVEGSIIIGALGFGASLALGLQATNADIFAGDFFALWALGLTPLVLLTRSVGAASVALAAGTVAAVIDASLATPSRPGSNLVALPVFAIAAFIVATRIDRAVFGDLARAGYTIVLVVFVESIAARRVPHDGWMLSALLAGVSALILLTGRMQLTRVAGTIAALGVPLWGTYWFAARSIAEGAGRPAFAAALRDPAIAAALALTIAACALRLWSDRELLLAAAVPMAAFAFGFIPYVVTMPPALGAAIANLAFAVPVVAWIRLGIARPDRTLFLAGILILTSLGVLRFFEYDTGLLLKSAAFLAAGAAFIAAALNFSRFAKGAAS